LADFYALAVVVRVPNVAEACALLRDQLGFSLREERTGEALLDNGALCFRLVEGRANARLAIELTTKQLDETLAAWTSKATLVTEAAWVSNARREARLHVADWLELVVSRTYDEDELGVVPALPSSLPWRDDAETMLKAALTCVPVAFRGDARVKATQRAEELAVVEGTRLEVDIGLAARALLEVTPPFQHERLQSVLRAHGAGSVA
jgi:hypothetical protein